MSLADPQWCPTSVQVTVLQARGLRIKGKSGTNDAYAVMQLGKDKYQTSVVEKSVAPVWKEEATFDLPTLLQGARGGGGGGGGGAERSTLHVHVLHRALVGPDKLLGQAVINLPQLSEDKDRNKTEWFKLLDKTGKPDKERGEVLVDIQFMRNNMTASMFDLSAAGKSRSRLGKFKDKVRGKKKESDSASSVVPSFNQVLTDSEEEEANGEGVGEASKDGKSKKHKMKSLFSPKSNLQRNLSQSMSVLPAKNSSVSGSQSSGLNVDPSEGKKKFKFMMHKRSGSSDSKDSSFGHQKQVTAEQSNLCINGSHIYCEEPPPRTSRTGSNYSLVSSGRGSMEDVPENSPPSVDSLRATRQYSPWMEEEEDEDKTENVHNSVDESREEDEKLRLEEEERKRTEETRQKELEILAKEKLKQESKKLEEKVRREEEERIREEKEKKTQEEEKRKREEEERVRREDEKKRLEEEERAEQRRQEERRLAEEKKVKEEEERRIEEEKVRREEVQKRNEEVRAEEERRRREAEEEMRKLEELKRQTEEEEMRKQQEAKRQEEERTRKEKEEYERLMEEKRKLEEEKKRIEAEEKLRKEEEEKMRMEEEMRRKDERRARREEELAEKRRLEEQERKRVEQEKMQREEEERIRKDRLKEMEETRRRQQEELEKLEEERRKTEEEKVKREEEERIRREEMRRQEQEMLRRQEEEQERLAKEMLRQQEEERKKLEEMVKREEEQIRRKEEMRQKEEEKARQEKEMAERLALEAKRLQEQEKRRIEEAARKEEEERIRREEKAEKERKEKEAKALENEILTREVEECEKKSGTNDGEGAAEEKTKVSTPRDISSTNPFDEDFSYNPSVDIPSSSSGPHSHEATEEMVQERCQSSVFVVGSRAVSANEKDPVGMQREKRLAPQPPGKNPAERPRQDQQDESEIKQTKDKTVKTVSVLPQRSVQIITPLSKSLIDSENTQNVTQDSGTKVTSARHKRPAPSRPCSVEEPLSESKTALSNKGVSETKQSAYSLNPFDDDDEDENELTAQDDTAVTGPVHWPPVASRNPEKDGSSQVKKSYKIARAPRPPAKSDATSSNFINDGGHVTGSSSRTVTNGGRDPQSEARNDVNVLKSPKELPQTTVKSIMVSGVKEEGPPSSRRLQPVKPLNPPEQQSASIVQVENNKSTGILSGNQDKTKVDGGVVGPYSQLTREELISLVLKQESQLSDRDKKISELEQYIDNLLVRVIEEKPSILLSMSSLKKTI